MSSSHTVLIVGARGRFGLACAQAFAQAGWQVLAQVRPDGRDDATLRALPGLRLLPVALDDAALAQAAAGAKLLVHAVNPAYTDAAWRTQALPLLENSLRLALRLNARLLLPGNVYNFGEQLPARLTEDMAQRAGTVKGQVRIAMEQRLQQAVQHEGLRAVVLRAGNFFGAGRGNWIDQVMLTRIARGRLTYPGPLDVPGAWAYLPDLARTVVAVAQRESAMPAFETLHFAGHTLTGQDWFDALAPIAQAQGWIQAGAALKPGWFPWPLLRLIARFKPLLASLVEMRYLWQRPHQLDNRRLQALIGAEPHTPLALALQLTLADLGLLGQADANIAHLESAATVN